MRIAVSLKEQRKSKAHLRKEMKNYKVLVKEVAEKVPFHIQTVKAALDAESKYWNQQIIDAAWELIEEKKNPVATAI